MNINKRKHIKINVIKLMYSATPVLLLSIAFYLHNLTIKVIFSIAALLVFLLKTVHFKLKIKKTHYEFINLSPNERKQLTIQLKNFLTQKRG